MIVQRLREASFADIWQHVIDPLYLGATATPDTCPLWPEPVLDVLALWVLHGVASRSGLASMVAEEPPWMAEQICGAAERLGHDDIAFAWARATRGVDFEVQSGRPPERVRIADPRALESLQEALVTGRHAELNRWLVDWIRANPTDFATAT